MTQSMVYEGRDGWLFLKNDSNHIVDQITGSYELPMNFSTQWRELLAYRAAQADARGYRHLTSFVPNKYP